jgi:EF hand domain-containing protein
VGSKFERVEATLTITPFLDRKLAQRFRTYDADGDGYIEQADFEESVTRMGEAFGHGPDSPARKRLLDLSLQLWQRLATVADVNHDGRISEAEYKAAFAKGCSKHPRLSTKATYLCSTPSWKSPIPTTTESSTWMNK